MKRSRDRIVTSKDIALYCRPVEQRIFDRAFHTVTQTNQLPPEPRPETFPRFSFEMPGTTGCTILSEAPLKRMR